MAVTQYCSLACLTQLQTSEPFEGFEMATYPNTRLNNTPRSAETHIAADNGTPLALIPFFQLSTKVGMGRSRIYALIGEGKFPAPVKIGASSRWIVREIDTYIAQLAATRNSNLTGE